MYIPTIDQQCPNDNQVTVSLKGNSVSVGASQVSDPPLPGDNAAPIRSSITELSDRSSKRMGEYLSTCTANYLYMGTLTVGSDWSVDGTLFKEALRQFFQQVQRYWSSKDPTPGEGISEQSIFWWLEFQQRGAPHVHFFYTDIIPYKLASTWWFDACCRAGTSRDPLVLLAGVRVERLRAGRRGCIVYAKKYAVKSDQKEVPEPYIGVGRFWGVKGAKEVVGLQQAPSSSPGALARADEVEKHLNALVNSGVMVAWTWRFGKGTTYYFNHWISAGDQYEILTYLASLLDVGEREAVTYCHSLVFLLESLTNERAYVSYTPAKSATNRLSGSIPRKPFD